LEEHVERAGDIIGARREVGDWVPKRGRWHRRKELRDHYVLVTVDLDNRI
jgi:hypothetical protein